MATHDQGETEADHGMGATGWTSGDAERTFAARNHLDRRTGLSQPCSSRQSRRLWVTFDVSFRPKINNSLSKVSKIARRDFDGRFLVDRIVFRLIIWGRYADQDPVIGTVNIRLVEAIGCPIKMDTLPSVWFVLLRLDNIKIILEDVEESIVGRRGLTSKLRQVPKIDE